MILVKDKANIFMNFSVFLIKFQVVLLPTLIVQTDFDVYVYPEYLEFHDYMILLISFCISTCSQFFMLTH